MLRYGDIDIEDWAKHRINRNEKLIKRIKNDIDSLKAKLGKRGYRVVFIEDKTCDNIEGEIICDVSRKGESFPKNMQLRTRATCSKDDVYIREFGEYLSLARAANIILKGG